MLACVVNISEGRRDAVIDAVAASAADELLDLHSDADHNRTVLTLVGEAAPRAVATAAIRQLDLRDHVGVHPRFGVVDVVPFMPLTGSTMTDAVAARDRFLAWLAGEHSVPGFAYGPERTLPEVRRRAFVDLAPDVGPDHPHATAGATAVGARGPLVAWNVWLAQPDVPLARRIAAEIRGPHIRALGLMVGDGAQVSMNLLSPNAVGPAEAWDLVAARAPVARAELVGLVPRAVLERTPRQRWDQLDLAEDKTFEHRLTARAPHPGSG
jgi:glutamate formiminotransferase